MLNGKRQGQQIQGTRAAKGLTRPKKASSQVGVNQRRAVVL